MPSPHRLPLLLALSLLATACTTFGGVRSAAVRPGLSAEASVASSGSVGDVSGWFWSDECVYPCDRDVVGIGGRVTYGFPARTGPALALSVGVDGLHPHVEGYAQLSRGRVPFGVGARVGVGLGNMPREHGLFARVDVPVAGRTRLLLNPALFVHEDEWFGGDADRYPNGAPLNPTGGTFLGFAQGIGLEYDAGHVSFTPAVTIVRARARHGGYEEYGPEWTTFPVASLGVSVGRKR